MGFRNNPVEIKKADYFQSVALDFKLLGVGVPQPIVLADIDGRRKKDLHLDSLPFRHE